MTRESTLPQRVLRRYLTALTGLPVDVRIWLHSVTGKIKLDAKRIEANIRALQKADEDEDVRQVCRYLEYSFNDFESVLGSLNEILDRIKLAFRLGKLKDFEGELHLGDLENFFEFKKLQRTGELDLNKALETMREWETPAAVTRAYRESVELIRGVVQRIELMAKRIMGAKNLKPEKVEKLYHASCNARELYQSGFKQTRPEGGMGLGGSVDDNSNNPAISFTHDLGYALSIARWFKEMAMVASGDITASQIFRLAEKDGVAEKVFEYATGQISSVGDRFEGGQVRLDFSGGKLRVVRTTWVPAKNELVTEVEDPDELFKNKRALYDLYVSYILQSPHRSNPVSMNATKTLEVMAHNNISPRDIGVITAEVDMTDPDVLYVPGEAEYRVPPRAIVKIVKFVGE